MLFYSVFLKILVILFLWITLALFYLTGIIIQLRGKLHYVENILRDKGFTVRYRHKHDIVDTIGLLLVRLLLDPIGQLFSYFFRERLNTTNPNSHE